MRAVKVDIPVASVQSARPPDDPSDGSALCNHTFLSDNTSKYLVWSERERGALMEPERDLVPQMEHRGTKRGTKKLGEEVSDR